MRFGLWQPGHHSFSGIPLPSTIAFIHGSKWQNSSPMVGHNHLFCTVGISPFLMTSRLANQLNS